MKKSIIQSYIICKNYILKGENIMNKTRRNKIRELIENNNIYFVVDLEDF